jgi:hypothetical protein
MLSFEIRRTATCESIGSGEGATACYGPKHRDAPGVRCTAISEG